MDLLLKEMAREEPLLLVALSNTETVEKARVKTGEIATDLAYYLSASEQTPAAVSLGVHVERDNKVKASGGLYFAFVFGAGFILESLCVLWLTYEGIMHGPSNGC